MKIAVSAEGIDLDAGIASRFGASAYLLIVDTETGELEAVPNPSASSHQRGAGMQTVVLAISKDVTAVLTGYCSPVVQRHLSAAGIEVLTGLSGTVRDAVEHYQAGYLRRDAAESKPGPTARWTSRAAVVLALRSSTKQFAFMLPILVGVVLLIGLFNTFVSPELLSGIFTGNTALDALWGACFGSILAGNPINSYIIGGGLLQYGVSLFAVTAFIVTWVTVGVVQLPAEIAALGTRFALVRNALCFVVALPVAVVTVVILNLITGWTL